MNLQWMAWTLPTAIFFVTIALILVGMTVWQLRSPSVARRGFLPLETTPGDRLFISLLFAAYFHLAWLAVTDVGLWLALAISALAGVAIMRYG